MGRRSLSLVRYEPKYLAIRELHSKHDYPVETLCTILELNRSSYYKWLRGDHGAQETKDGELIDGICVLYRESNGIFGYRRMQLNLVRRFRLHANRKRVYRVMRAIGLKSVIRRKRPGYVRTTTEIVAENVLKREFTADQLNEKWLTDVTEFKYGDGRKLYLSAILDLKDKSIVSWSIGSSNNTSLVFETFDAAVQKYPDAGPLFHSDRGFQYTGRQFRAKLNARGMTQSMSRVGCCIDNGPMEAFWGTLKAEMYYLRKFQDRERLERAIEDYIRFYNNGRFQEKLGGLAPLEYRALLLGTT